MDVREVQRYLIHATEEVCRTALGLPVEVGTVDPQSGPPGAADGVVALLGLVGNWVGVGSLTCEAGVACNLSGRLLLTEFNSVTDEVLDAIGELANMIIGNFKTHFEERVGPLGLSIPTVIYGKNFTARSPHENSWLRVPFSSELGLFDVRVCLEPNARRVRATAHLALVEESQS